MGIVGDPAVGRNLNPIKSDMRSVAAINGDERPDADPLLFRIDHKKG